MTLAEKIAGYGASLRYEDISGEAVHEAKKRLLDSLACAIGAYGCPPFRITLDAFTGAAKGSRAGIIGSDMLTSPDHASFANGILIRYLDFNDTYLSKEPAHPSDNIAAALSVSEAEGKGGKELLRAMVAAYEVQCALCDAASLRARGWDHVAYLCFSSALCAGMLMGLGKDGLVNAINIAGANSAALRQTRAGILSMWKGCAGANAVRHGVFSAMLARGGMTGPSPIFEGEHGFCKQVAGRFELPELARGRGSRYRILDTNIKTFPAEYHIQSAIQAAMEISELIGNADDIESVKISTCGAAYEITGFGEEKWKPVSREGADHSLAYCVGAALIDGTVNLDTFSDDRLKDSRLMALVEKIKIEKDDALDRLYPEAIPNRVEVKLKSNEYLVREVIYPKGHPKNPLEGSEVEDKFRALGGWLFSGPALDKVFDIVWNIDRSDNISGLLSLFTKGGP